MIPRTNAQATLVEDVRFFVSDVGFADPKLPEGLFEIKLEPALENGRYVMVKRGGSDFTEAARCFIQRALY